MNSVHAAAIATVAIVAPIRAQLPDRQFTAVHLTTIGAERLDIAGISGAAVTPAGELALGDPQDLVVVIVSPTGKIRRIGRAGEGPGEFRNIREVAVLDGELWVADSRLLRLQSFGSGGRVAEVVGYRNALELPDGSRLVVRPGAMASRNTILFHVTVTGTPRPGVSSKHPVGTVGAMSMDTSGSNVTELVWARTGGECQQILDGGIGFFQPFCAEPQVVMNGDGRSLVLLEPQVAGSGKSAFRATTVDLVSGRRISAPIVYEGLKVRSSDWDSVYARAASRMARAPQLARAMDALPRERLFPPFGNAAALNDGRTLIQVFIGDPALGHWLVLESGRPLGMLALPIGERPLGGTMDALWVLATDRDGVHSLSRYQLR